MAEAACTRASLQLLLATRGQVAKLAEVEALLAGKLDAAACLGGRPTPGRRRPDASAVQVQGCLDAAAAAATRPLDFRRTAPFAHAAGSCQQASPPSVLRGVVARIKFSGSYHLLPVEGLAVAADGAPALVLLSPEASPDAARLLHVPVSAASSTDPLAEASWEAVGRGEVARLASLLQRRGQGLPLADVSWAAGLSGGCVHACAAAISGPLAWL